MDKDFLLATQTAKELYHGCAAGLPILDYHCHISPQEIFEDRRFENITQVWLGGENPAGGCAGDHYKWRLMRANGVEEQFVTGSAPDRERFQKWAETLDKAIGNPLYHWSHLELQRFFGYKGVLGADTSLPWVPAALSPSPGSRCFAPPTILPTISAGTRHLRKTQASRCRCCQPSVLTGP